MVSIWILRNTFVLETEEVIITTSSGSALAIGWNKQVPIKHTNTKGDLLSGDPVLEGYDYIEDDLQDEVKRNRIFRNATVNFIRTNPDLIIPIINKKLKSAFNPLPENPKPGILELGRVIYHVLALIGLIYILFLAENKLPKSLVLSLIFSTIAITVLTFSGFRFRMPQLVVEIFLIIYAIHAISQRYKRPKLTSNNNLI